MDTMTLHRRADDAAEPALPARRLETHIRQARARMVGRRSGRAGQDHPFRIVSPAHVGSDGWLKTLDFRAAVRSPTCVTCSKAANAPTARPSSRARASARARPTSCCGRACRRRSSIRSARCRRSCCSARAGRDGRPLPESPDTIVRAAFDRARRTRRRTARARRSRVLPRQAHEPEDLRRRRSRLSRELAVRVRREAAPHRAHRACRDRRADQVRAQRSGLHPGVRERRLDLGNSTRSKWDLRRCPTRPRASCSRSGAAQSRAPVRHARASDPILRKGHGLGAADFHFSPVVNGRHSRGPRWRGRASRSRARRLIGGFVQHGGALMAFGNRVEGSFVRLTQGQGKRRRPWRGASSTVTRSCACRSWPRRPTAAGERADDRVPPARRLRASAPAARRRHAGDARRASAPSSTRCSHARRPRACANRPKARRARPGARRDRDLLADSRATLEAGCSAEHARAAGGGTEAAEGSGIRLTVVVKTPR